jgi:hypothetical protein
MGMHRKGDAMTSLNQDAIYLKGEDVDTGLRDCIKENMKGSFNKSYDLGKFIVSVSIGTIGFIAALAKTGIHQETIFIISIIILFASIIFSVNMSIPKKANLDSNVDLLDLYIDVIKTTSRNTWIWFVFWLLGSLLGLYSLLF